ncbi:MFS transporter [Streptomyces sp. NPDC096046]|uniref:MFS transporter n=1 Tax=Streptomyces sp. NPDC096046 TaxID=3155542 RepID=UPI00331B6CFE
MPVPPRRQPEPGACLIKRSGDGFRLPARHPRQRWMFLASLSLDMAFSWPAEVALPLLVSQRGWGVGAVGVVLAAFSVGALGSSALGAVLAHRIPMYVRLVVTGAGLAAGILVMAVMPSVVSLTAVAAAVGLLSGLNGPAIVTLYQKATPEGRMGAEMSTLALAGIGTAPIPIAVFSSLSLALGVQTTWAAVRHEHVRLPAGRRPRPAPPGPCPGARAEGRRNARAGRRLKEGHDRPDRSPPAAAPAADRALPLIPAADRTARPAPPRARKCGSWTPASTARMPSAGRRRPWTARNSRAAECADRDSKAEGLKFDRIVRVGSSHCKSGGSVREIDRTFVHPRSRRGG